MSVRTHQFVQAESRRFVLLSFTLQPAKDIQGYVALCPALGVATQGTTPEEAENNIREAVGLYLTAIDDDGDLERIFAEKPAIPLSTQPRTPNEAIPRRQGGRAAGSYPGQL